MQTFLPLLSIYDSLWCLDYRRLGKQRVEADQILNILNGKAKSKAWANHPAVLMWKGHELALTAYRDLSIYTWVERGYKNNMKQLYTFEYALSLSRVLKPEWITEEFCRAHQSNLLRKAPDFYKQYDWNVPDNLPYIWPVSKNKS